MLRHLLIVMGWIVLASQIQPPELGNVTITTDPGTCERATTFTLWRLTRTDFGWDREPAYRTDGIAPCRWTVTDLKPGTYEASLKGPDFSARTPIFEINAGSETRVGVPVPMVTVSGRVTYNGDALANTPLNWAMKSRFMEGRSVTDPDGKYRLTLAEPGEYFVNVDRDGFLQRFDVATLHDGANDFDWKLTGGTLTASVQRWNQASGVTIVIRSPRSSAGFTLNPGDQPSITRSGVEFDTYDVSARQSGVKLFARNPHPVTIDARHPNQRVDLELGPDEPSLSVTDPDGRRVTDVRVRAGDRMAPLEQIEPGVFGLEGMPSGTPLRIKPHAGLVPTCRQVPETGSLAVMLATGRNIELQVPGPIDQIAIGLGRLIGFAGAECPVAFTDFSWRKLEGTVDGRSRFMLEGFPDVGSIVREVDGRREEIAVPVSGVIVLSARHQ